jgi:hypothetical protein
MATSQHPKPQRRRPSVGDRSATGAGTSPGTDLTPDSTTEHRTGHPNARGTLPMAAPTPPTNPPVRLAPRGDRPDPATGDPSAGVRHRSGDHPRLARRDGRSPRQRQPRPAKLRAVLRDETLMAHVRANVERWPPLTDEQRDTLCTGAPNGPIGGPVSGRLDGARTGQRGVPHDRGRPVASGPLELGVREPHRRFAFWVGPDLGSPSSIPASGP